MIPGAAEAGSPLAYEQALWIAIGVVLVLGAITAVLAVLVIGHHFFSDRNRRVNRERFEAATKDLAAHLVASEGELLEAVRRSISRNGRRATALVLRKSRLELKGPAAERISDVLQEIGVTRELKSQLASRREWKREHAARGLGECGGVEAMHALMVGASDSSPAVRRASREGLLTMDSEEAVTVAIRSFLQDLPRRAGWKRAFYSRLSSTNPLELLKLIRSGQLDRNEIKLALEALGDAGAQPAVSLAGDLLHDDDPEIRATAIRVLGKLDRVEYLDHVTTHLTHESWFVRAASARSLEWILGTGDSRRMDRSARMRAVDALASTLSDRAWWVRANGARALARAGRDGRTHLFKSANGADPFAVDASLAALALVTLDRDEQEQIRGILDQRRAAAVSAEMQAGEAPA